MPAFQPCNRSFISELSCMTERTNERTNYGARLPAHSLPSLSPSLCLLNPQRETNCPFEEEKEDLVGQTDARPLYRGSSIFRGTYTASRRARPGCAMPFSRRTRTDGRYRSIASPLCHFLAADRPTDVCWIPVHCSERSRPPLRVVPSIGLLSPGTRFRRFS